ncbi:MAG: hypothetical protein KAG84_05560 [Bacteroidales bacterium]|nr:hypothetical protein [Bacteroidales bacterium]
MVTILTSTNIEELQLFKSVLESHNIFCTIEISNISTHKFYTSAGGKLIIDDYNLYDAQAILSKYGNTQADAALNIGVEQSEEELRLKGKIRKLNHIPSIEEFQINYSPINIKPSLVAKIFNEEKQYVIHRNNNKFDLNEFLAHLFEGKFFEYINRNRSTKYEIENELIEKLEMGDDLN